MGGFFKLNWEISQVTICKKKPSDGNYVHEMAVYGHDNVQGITLGKIKFNEIHF